MPEIPAQMRSRAGRSLQGQGPCDVDTGFQVNQNYNETLP